MSNTNSSKSSKTECEELYTKIVDLVETEKLTYQAISNMLNISKTTVHNYIEKWKKRVPVLDIRPRGGITKITPKIRQGLGQIVTRENVPTSKAITREVCNSYGVEVTPRSVRRHLNTMGYKSSVPKPIPSLTDKQKKKQYDWCVEHLEYDWSKVWFSDETYIEMNSMTTRIFHKKSEKPTYPKKKFDVKIMIWGAVSIRNKSTLTIIDGSVNSERYIEVLRGFFDKNRNGFNKKKMIFQQDGATCHTSKKTREFIEQNGVTLLYWPANSPDLNPIENIWSILKGKVEKHKICSKQQLIDVVHTEWANIDQGVIERTFTSMTTRVKEVIENMGGKCKY